jgi:hypothetical protein
MLRSEPRPTMAITNNRSISSGRENRPLRNTLRRNTASNCRGWPRHKRYRRCGKDGVPLAASQTTGRLRPFLLVVEITRDDVHPDYRKHGWNDRTAIYLPVLGVLSGVLTAAAFGKNRQAATSVEDQALTSQPCGSWSSWPVSACSSSSKVGCDRVQLTWLGDCSFPRMSDASSFQSGQNICRGRASDIAAAGVVF